jgi:hypothetical protein
MAVLLLFLEHQVVREAVAGVVVILIQVDQGLRDRATTVLQAPLWAVEEEEPTQQVPEPMVVLALVPGAHNCLWPM